MKYRIVSLIISLMAVVAFSLNWKFRDGRDLTTTDLVFLGIALFPWIGEFVGKISWGQGTYVEFHKRLDRVEREAAAALDAGLRGLGRSNLTRNLLGSGRSDKQSENIDDIECADSSDPQKGRWGGHSSVKGRQLTARIEKIPGEDFYRRVILMVSSTDRKRPLGRSARVRFHLHPTFSEPESEVRVHNGKARTSIVSYGAFTIGAEVLEGNQITQLELDLTSLDDQEDMFFKR